jgi:hypothetical protein
MVSLHKILQYKLLFVPMHLTSFHLLILKILEPANLVSVSATSYPCRQFLFKYRHHIPPRSDLPRPQGQREKRDLNTGRSRRLPAG